MAERLLRERRHPKRYTTRLTRPSEALGPIETYRPLLKPPWTPPDPRNNQDVSYNPKLTKEEAARLFEAWLATIPPIDIVVFTDGSKGATTGAPAGAGWVVFQRNVPSIRGRLRLEKAEVFDAEAIAATEGLRAAIGSVGASYATNLYVCLDNLEVARNLLRTTNTSSQLSFTTFKSLASKWPARGRHPLT